MNDWRDKMLEILADLYWEGVIGKRDCNHASHAALADIESLIPYREWLSAHPEAGRDGDG